MPKSYHSYTVQFKVSVVDWHNANGANLSKTSREFEIDRKRIREWIANYDTLRLNCHGRGKRKRCLHDGAAVFSEELDRALYTYLEETVSDGLSLSNKELQKRAKEIAGGMDIGEFKASHMWLARWKKR